MAVFVFVCALRGRCGCGEEMGWDGMRAGRLQESKENGGIEIDLEASTT